MRDGVADSTEHNFSKAYTNIDPLPTIEELQAVSFYVRYVPKDKQSETLYPKRVIVSNKSEYEGFF